MSEKVEIPEMKWGDIPEHPPLATGIVTFCKGDYSFIELSINGHLMFPPVSIAWSAWRPAAVAIGTKIMVIYSPNGDEEDRMYEESWELKNEGMSSAEVSASRPDALR